MNSPLLLLRKSFSMATARIQVSFEGATQQEIAQKMQEYLQQLKGYAVEAPTPVEDFADDVKKLYPKYRKNPFSAAMLSVILEHPKDNKIDVYDLAEQMQKRFPSILKSKGYDRYEDVTMGTVLAGNFLRESKLIDYEEQPHPDGYRRRLYWRN